MAPSIKCLPCKHEDLNSDPQNPNKKPGMRVRAYNPSTVETQAGEIVQRIYWTALASSAAWAAFSMAAARLICWSSSRMRLTAFSAV